MSKADPHVMRQPDKGPGPVPYLIIIHTGNEDADDNTLYLRKDGTVSPSAEDETTDGYWDSWKEAQDFLNEWLKG